MGLNDGELRILERADLIDAVTQAELIRGYRQFIALSERVADVEREAVQVTKDYAAEAATLKAQLAAQELQMNAVRHRAERAESRNATLTAALQDCHMQAKRMTWRKAPDHLTGWANIKLFCERAIPELGGHNLLRTAATPDHIGDANKMVISDHIPDAGKMVYTRERPKLPLTYWYRHTPECEPRAMRVMNDLKGAVDGGGYCCMEELTGEWAGPIPLPLDGKGA